MDEAGEIRMIKSVAILNIKLNEGIMLNSDMAALKKFLTKISRDDLIDIHNLTVELINEPMQREQRD